MSENSLNSTSIVRLLVLFTGLLVACGCSEHRVQLKSEKIFINGKIITMDDRVPKVEALAVANGKIISVGTTAEIRNSHPKAEVKDLKGKTVMPGIVESHGHLLSLGQSLLELNLSGVRTPQEAVQKVQERVRTIQEGEWIVGWGWDEGAWAKDYPTNDELNGVSPKNPVCLRGLHGFASWVNKKALEIAGISSETPNPTNGEIMKDPRTGNPTGILTNKAQELVARFIPSLTKAQVEKALILAIDECLKYGLTTVHEANTTAAMLDAFRSLKRKNELKCRIYVMLDGTDKKLLEPFFAKGPEIDQSQFLTVRCIKIFIDGALGSRGAALLEPYSDAPEAKGLIVTSEDSLYQLTVQALKSGLQVAVHAIGDRANRVALNAFGRALAEVRDLKDHRLRVEHGQVASLEDVPKFSPLGIVLSMQPPHCTSDMSWAEARLGPERIKGAYAWRSFIKTGVHLALNSDFPGETLNPFYGMYAAETRQTPSGKPEGGWYPDQRLSRQEVLNAYTVESAYSGFEEGIKGQIIPGMLADFIVLSDDILYLPSQKLLDLRVMETYIGGKLVYREESGVKE